MDVCRVVVDPEPMSGAWNMAVDEALLESAVSGGAPTVRFYRWDRATLSLGYFQVRRGAPPDRFNPLPIVRRLTGGGAIVHDDELTYSCTLPASHPFAFDPRRLYTEVHERVIARLGDFGFAAALRGVSEAAHQDKFLCFARRDDFDVVMGGFKVLGSAQRRRRGAVLQHGSLILRRSEWAGEFPGVFDCAGRDVPASELVESLANSIGSLLAPRSRHSAISPEEHGRAQLLASCVSPAIAEINK